MIDPRITTATDDQLLDWMADIVVEEWEPASDFGSPLCYWNTGLVNEHDGLLAEDVVAEAIKRGIW